MKVLTRICNPERAGQQVSCGKPVPQIPKEIVQGYPVPKPRPKPIEVLMMAAANMTIEPASAPPPTQLVKPKPSVVADNLGAVEAAETLTEEQALAQMSNAAAKGSFADAIRDGTVEGPPIIKPVMASLGASDINWWPAQPLFDPEKAVRRDGAPQEFTTTDISLVPNALAQPVLRANSDPAQSLESAAGKGDMLVVQRAGKGSLPASVSVFLQGYQQLGQLESN